jgi:hypothetical protein
MKKTMLGLALGVVSSLAIAGTVNHVQVFVDSATRTAYGSMTGARFSADATQTIGCMLVNSGSPYGWCLSRNAAGVYGSCTTTDPMHMQQITGLSNESYLYYQWDATGKCTYIFSKTDSQYHN